MTTKIVDLSTNLTKLNLPFPENRPSNRICFRNFDWNGHFLISHYIVVEINYLCPNQIENFLCEKVNTPSLKDRAIITCIEQKTKLGYDLDFSKLPEEPRQMSTLHKNIQSSCSELYIPKRWAYTVQGTKRRRYFLMK